MKLNVTQRMRGWGLGLKIGLGWINLRFDKVLNSEWKVTLDELDGRV